MRLLCTVQFLSCHLFSFILPPANPGDSLNSNSRCLRSRYIASGSPHRKHRFLYGCVLIDCCRDVFTTPLLSKERGADHRKRRFSIFARVRFHGNVFTEQLPSNKLFRLSGVMSQYILDTVREVYVISPIRLILHTEVLLLLSAEM
jgi:hypothetical protein